MIYIIGDGGHARVVADILESMGHRWHMMSRDKEEEWLANDPTPRMIAIGIGMKKHKVDICNSLMHRYAVAARYLANGFSSPPLVHKQAIKRTVQIGNAAQIMAGAIVQVGTIIHAAAIINTGAQVDHDCTIGMGAHIAPGAVICGGVTIGDCTLIGANATVLPGIKIGPHVVVPAGEVVRKDI